MKRTLAILVWAAVAAAAVMAAGATEPAAAAEAKSYLANLTPAGTLPVVKEKVTFKVLAQVEPNIQDINTNYATRWIEGRTNVHLEWQNVQGSDASEKIRLVLSSGKDLPDILLRTGFNPLQFALFGGQGILLPLEGYFEKYGHWLNKAAQENPRVRNENQSADGHLYVIGTLELGRHGEYPSKLWINKTWLDKLGLAMPSTPDELYAAYKAIKTRDPNGNGKADEVPLSSASSEDISTFFLNAWLYADSDDRLTLAGDKVAAQFIQPEWRDGVRWLARLAREGLLDVEAFVQDNSVLKQLVMGPEIRLGSFTALMPTSLMPANSAQTKNYTTLAPLRGPGGNATTHYRPKAVQSQFGFSITKACAQPEVAFRWADFLYSREAYEVMFFGEEGVDWRRANPGEKGISGEPALYWNVTTPWSEAQQNKVWFHTAPFYATRDVFLGRAVKGDDPWFIAARLDRETVAKYLGKEPKQVMPPTLPLGLDVAEEYAELRMTINEYVRQSLARFIVGDLNIETGWDAYLAQLKSMKLDRYLEIVQRALAAGRK